MTNFFDQNEYITVAERGKKQNALIMRMLKKAHRKSPRIKKIFHEKSINPSDIKTLNDLELIPVISREKLVEMEMEEPPFGGLENPDKKIDRIFISPGPVYEPHLSEKDYLWARAYHAAGIGEKDVVLNAFSYHMVAAGLTFHGGLRRVGATVVPSGTSSSEMQVQMIRDLGVTAYTGTPSFLRSIIQKAEEMGYAFKRNFRVKKACFAAEPLQPFLRKIFENEYAIDTYQMYGATEVGDVAFECHKKDGWHICEEVYVEIVDPVTGKKMPHGAIGEVVVTRPNDIFFLFRFGTGDLSRIITAPCACGRTSYRLDGIVGRIGEAVKVRGMFVAPSQIKKISAKFNDRKIQIIVSRSEHEDIVTARIEKKSGFFSESTFEEHFKKYFKDICAVRVDNLEFVKAGTLDENYQVIIDQRTWK